MLGAKTPGPDRDPADRSTHDPPDERRCKTIPLVDNFSTCLSNDPECKYIFSFGFSYLCLHPRHRDFNVK